MWIFLIILALLILIITTALLLPIHIIIKTDQSGEMIFRYKILFKTFGDEPKSDSQIAKTLKDILGVPDIDKDKLKENAQKGDLLETFKKNLTLIKGLLKRLLELLKHCTVKVLKIEIVCAERDAAQTAIDYGRCYAVISPLLSFLHSSMKVRKKGEKINITCDFGSGEGSYKFESVVAVRVFRILGAFLRAALDTAKTRKANN